MRCEVCGLDEGEKVDLVALKVGRDCPSLSTAVNAESEPRIACPQCVFLVVLPEPETEFEHQLSIFSRRQWAAHRRGEPFFDDPPRSKAELAAEAFAARCLLLEPQNRAKTGAAEARTQTDGEQVP